MSSKSWFAVITVVCFSALLVTGCRKPLKPQQATTGTEIKPESIETVTSELPDRPAPGTTPVASAFDKVLFGYDSFQIADSEVPKIQTVAEFMKGKATVQTTCEGNCDERGSAEYNMALGENRALAVRAYLIQLGVDGNRLQTKSYGEDKPSDTRHCEEAWQQNRRVEFALFE